MTIAESIAGLKSLKLALDIGKFKEAIDAAEEVLNAVNAEGIPDADELLDVLNDAKQLGLAYGQIAPLHIPGRPVYSDGVIHCPNCNGRVHAMWSYCNKCGKRLSW